MSSDRPCAALRQALVAPLRLGSLTDAQWSDLIAVARAANLLGALAAKLEAAGIAAPAAPRGHLHGALQLSRRQKLSVTWEVHCLQEALGPLNIPVVLLKGAAYVMAGHDVGRGRLFGDVDLLVPRASIGAVERQLLLNGWTGAKSDAYDQRYYRDWMHELPPMVHMKRGAVVDVHHNILPLTARYTPDPARIIERSVSIPGLPNISVPSPADMVIHSLTHLMHEGELHNGLRDLHDIDEMLRQFGTHTAFWAGLVQSAIQNDLAHPVQDGLQLARLLFGTPVPEDAYSALTTAGRLPPKWLEPVYRRALEPARHASGGALSALARMSIYVRAHALRMPLPMLARHLSIKGWRSLRGTRATLA